ncbi:MAG TPA: hypothetical protein VER55_08795 [Ardenticatenaceae bacterium]|nr:hypothetical protein [Ardenticatenaceae bacterium]
MNTRPDRPMIEALLVLVLLGCACICISGALLAAFGLGRLVTQREVLVVPPLPPEELLVDVSAFPDDWSHSTQVTGRHGDEFFYRAYDGAGQYYIYPNDVESGQLNISDPASHYVGRYPREERAMQDYTQLVNYYFLEEDSWYEPPRWTYRSTEAEEYRVRCTKHPVSQRRGETCRAIARYDRYVSVFRVYTDDTDLSYTELERILRAIDAEFAAVPRYTSPE